MISSVRPKIVTITGAESTGKTALTRGLSRHFNSLSFSEYSRQYVEEINGHYTYEDIVSIANMQHAQMSIGLRLKKDIIFFDTWLLITMVWSEVVFGKVPAWIPEAIKNAPVDLYLLCHTDIPWSPDPVRENGGEMREWLESRYLEIIRQYGLNYEIVTGSDHSRIINAIQFVKKHCELSENKN
jgi:NadR type nicotinamide-nucleotide adenylyltransferase